MPAPGMLWRHVIITTRRAWLHGDARGFRSRKHRIHSSGDYRNPPPAGEHGGLLRYHSDRAKADAIRILKALREELGRAILRAIVASGHHVLALSVSAKHVHVLVELPVNTARARAIVGKWKAVRTDRIRGELPGSIWGAGGKYKPIEDREHQIATFRYIRDHQGSGAWVWTFRDAQEGESGTGARG